MVFLSHALLGSSQLLLGFAKGKDLCLYYSAVNEMTCLNFPALKQFADTLGNGRVLLLMESTSSTCSSKGNPHESLFYLQFIDKYGKKLDTNVFQ